MVSAGLNFPDESLGMKFTHLFFVITHLDCGISRRGKFYLLCWVSCNQGKVARARNRVSFFLPKRLEKNKVARVLQQQLLKQLKQQLCLV